MTLLRSRLLLRFLVSFDRFIHSELRSGSNSLTRKTRVRCSSSARGDTLPVLLGTKLGRLLPPQHGRAAGVSLRLRGVWLGSCAHASCYEEDCANKLRVFHNVDFQTNRGGEYRLTQRCKSRKCRRMNLRIRQKARLPLADNLPNDDCPRRRVDDQAMYRQR